MKAAAAYFHPALGLTVVLAAVVPAHNNLLVAAAVAHGDEHILRRGGKGEGEWG